MINIFIVCKPLQYINAKNVSTQLNNERNLLFIVDDFKDARVFYSEIKKNTYWENVFFFESRKHALLSALKNRNFNIFVDGDLGYWFYFYSILFNIYSRGVISIYEEGRGVYRNNIYKNCRSYYIRKMSEIFFSVPLSYGGGVFTKKIYVYNKKKYVNNFPLLSDRVIEIKDSFRVFCETNLEELSANFLINDFLIDASEKFCVLYLSDWTFNEGMICRLKKKYVDARFFVKPHPHIKELKSNDDFDVIDTLAPAELIIFKLRKYFNEILVLHHGSSCVDNIGKCNGVNFVEIKNDV